MSNFEKNVIDIYGGPGEKWLAELADMTANLAEKYDLTDLAPVANMRFNYVAAGYKAGKPVILKLGLNHRAFAREAHCLRAFAKHGGVAVLASGDGMMIIEQAIPGVTLKDYFPEREDEAVRIVCTLIKRLHTAQVPRSNSFHNLRELLRALDDDLAIPEDILSKARRLRDELLASTGTTVLLHGDLHHENILQNGEDWVVIDPKGFIGDPVYEVCAFISNPVPQLLASPDPREIIHNRIKLCSRLLRFSEQKIRDWHFVQVVLSWAWQLEDGLDPRYFVRLLDTIN